MILRLYSKILRAIAPPHCLCSAIIVISLQPYCLRFAIVDPEVVITMSFHHDFNVPLQEFHSHLVFAPPMGFRAQRIALIVNLISSFSNSFSRDNSDPLTPS
ncbi:hypothetical protein VNO77_39159 [Canavalia gladiata]|uniref:Uncharacterized protein n=1 Tax=Canavalia gladiata TaxID=3824 RepID=A0AAN9PXI9_CANGL